MLFLHQHAIITLVISQHDVHKKNEETGGQESWRSIPDDFFKKLQKHLPKRVQAVFQHSHSKH